MAEMPCCPHLRNPLDASEDGNSDSKEVGPVLSKPREAVQDHGRDQENGESESTCNQEDDPRTTSSSEGSIWSGDRRPSTVQLGISFFLRVVDVQEET